MADFLQFISNAGLPNIIGTILVIALLGAGIFTMTKGGKGGGNGSNSSNDSSAG